MEDFTITTRLSIQEYRRVMIVGLYKKPAFILATVFGFFLLTTIVLDYIGIINYYSETPLLENIFGVFLLLMPLLIVWISVRQFTSNPSFQGDMIYTFSEEGVAIQGLTFKSEFLWKHIIKQKELDKFLILYHNKKFGNLIDKTKLTGEQLHFIKSKVRQ